MLFNMKFFSLLTIQVVSELSSCNFFQITSPTDLSEISNEGFLDLNIKLLDIVSEIISLIS